MKNPKNISLGNINGITHPRMDYRVVTDRKFNNHKISILNRIENETFKPADNRNLKAI